MSEKALTLLEAAVAEAVALIGRYRDKYLGEQNTKASLIEPILCALGWAIREPDEVHREYKPTPKDSPVDYALAILRKPRLFVEAKGLGETLSDRKWIAQVLGYAIVAGVEWCVLTDGDEYRIYNATAAVDAEEKLLCKIKLTEATTCEAVRILDLISRANMVENALDAHWNSQFVDRRVKQTLLEMVSTIDKGLVRLIRRRVGKLSPKEIVKSLRRLDVRIDSPSPIALSPPARKEKDDTAPTRTPKKRKQQKQKVTYSASLSDVVHAGLLPVPIQLFRKYRGKMLQATLRPDGKVDFEGTVFDSCSSAAEHARSTITGRRMNTNGWAFWQYADADGKKQTLFNARQRFLQMKGTLPTQG
jgi:hypothetical protein